MNEKKVLFWLNVCKGSLYPPFDKNLIKLKIVTFLKMFSSHKKIIQYNKNNNIHSMYHSYTIFIQMFVNRIAYIKYFTFFSIYLKILYIACSATFSLVHY